MNANDDTGAHDGNLVSGQYTPAGRHGAAFLFDGSQSIFTADMQDTLWPSGSFSIEAWVNATTTPVSFVRVVEKYGCAGAVGCDNSDYALLISPNGNPQFQYRTAPSGTNQPLVEIASLTNVVDGKWHHLVGVRDVHMAEQRLYVDGALAVTKPLGSSDLVALANLDGKPDPLTIGAGRISDQDTLGYFFRGAVDEVAIYFNALDDAEVAAIYDARDGICP